MQWYLTGVLSPRVIRSKRKRKMSKTKKKNKEKVEGRLHIKNVGEKEKKRGRRLKKKGQRSIKNKKRSKTMKNIFSNHSRIT